MYLAVGKKRGGVDVLSSASCAALGISPQERKRPIHVGGFALKFGVGLNQVADALHQRHDGGDVGPAQRDVDDAPAPCAGVELVDAYAA